ncbi:MAG: hypothetical protein M9938_00820 [Solirubrobacterales bacterium]|nr:hypothetical protein [Solirubrobacterales bacterium]
MSFKGDSRKIHRKAESQGFRVAEGKEPILFYPHAVEVEPASDEAPTPA